MRALLIALAPSVVMALALPAPAQFVCAAQGGPDVVVRDMPTIANYASEGGIEALSLSVVACNVGSQPLAYVFGTSQHPVFAQNLYRLKTVDGTLRFEQIGMSWLFHGTIALAGVACCQDCQPAGGSALGVHCSTSDTASIIGQQSELGPRWQVDPYTGQFPFPPADPPFAGSIARRLQVRISDIDPAQNAGATYFVEGVFVAPDDGMAGNHANNFSHRRTVIAGAGANWNFAMSGSAFPGDPAADQWILADPGVTSVTFTSEGDGELQLLARATELPAGRWHYEYALLNKSSDRGAGSFAVPLDADVVLSSIGFHDVDYHSGDGIGDVTRDGTDWPSYRDSVNLTWATATYAENPNANALGWGTLYNFRFDALAAPLPGGGPAHVGLFKPGESPSSLSAIVPAPGRAHCAGDVNSDGVVDLADLSRILSRFGTGEALRSDGDLTGDGIVDLADLSSLLAVFGSVCSA